MRLTCLLRSWKPEFMGHIPKFPGNSYYGKHRFVPPATKMSQYFVMRQIVWDESNARLLDAPYINEKQEQAYLQSVGRAHPEYQDEFLFKKLVIPDKQNYAADFLVTLDSNRPFESYE